jgi:hypothetical protein
LNSKNIPNTSSEIYKVLKKLALIDHDMSDPSGSEAKPEPAAVEYKYSKGSGPPYSEPGRSAWFKDTTPSSLRHARSGAFQKGLGASDEEMVAVYEQIRKECVKSDVLHVFLEGPHAKVPYKTAQDGIVRAIQSVQYTHETNINRVPVPEKWLVAWARACIQREWLKSKDLRKEPEVFVATGIPNTLSDTTFHLNILHPNAPAITNIVAEAEIIATRCVPRNLDILDPKNYLFSLFFKEFEYEFNNTANLASSEDIFREKPFNSKYGKLSFKTTYQTVKEITRQASFEAALTQLFNSRQRDTIVFYFTLDTPSEEKLREARELAAQRTKDNRGSKAGPSLRLSSKPPPSNDNEEQKEKKASRLTLSPKKIFQSIEPEPTVSPPFDFNSDLKRMSKWSISTAKSNKPDSIKAKTKKTLEELKGSVRFKVDAVKRRVSHPMTPAPKKNGGSSKKERREEERLDRAMCEYSLNCLA